MSYPVTQTDVERVKFLKQMEFSLRDKARRKEKKLEEMEDENAFAQYILDFFEPDKK